MTEAPKLFYRYMYDSETDYSWGGQSIRVRVEIWKLLKETKQGYWILPEFTSNVMFKKWIPKKSKKRYAYPTREEAWKSFQIRKTKQLHHTKVLLEKLKAMVNIRTMPREDSIRTHYLYEHTIRNLSNAWSSTGLQAICQSCQRGCPIRS